MKMEIKMEVVEEQRDSNPDGMEMEMEEQRDSNPDGMEMEMEEQRDSNPDGMEMEEQRDSNPGQMEMAERRDFSPDEVEMETEEQRDSNPDETEMDVNELRDSNPGGAQMDVKKLRDLSPDEVVVLQALLELARGHEGGHFASWGRRKRRSRGGHPSCKCDDSAAAPPVAVMDAAAGVKPAQGSPTTPLRWSRNDKPSVLASAPASTSSDSAAGPGPRPCDRPLGPKLKFKVERKSGVHKPRPIGKGSIGKGPKKKTLAELKELFIRLSSEKEEMEKEKEKLFNRFQSLSDKNMLLKRELELKLSTTGEPQPTVQSPTVSSDMRSPNVSIVADALDSSKNLVNNSSTAAAVGWYSSAEGILHCNDISWVGKSLQQDSLAPTKSLSHTFAIPDLNMPAEDVEDLSDNQVVQTNSKAIVAAEARKYRRECLRLKHSRSVKVHAR